MEMENRPARVALIALLAVLCLMIVMHLSISAEASDLPDGYREFVPAVPLEVAKESARLHDLANTLMDMAEKARDPIEAKGYHANADLNHAKANLQVREYVAKKAYDHAVSLADEAERAWSHSMDQMRTLREEHERDLITREDLDAQSAQLKHTADQARARAKLAEATAHEAIALKLEAEARVAQARAKVRINSARHARREAERYMGKGIGVD